MTQWQRLENVYRDSEAFRQRLGDLYIRIGFPIKVRSMLSHWIEAQDWLERTCRLFLFLLKLFLLLFCLPITTTADL